MLDVCYLARLIQTVLDGTPFPHVERAVPLLVGTAAHESHLQWAQQLGGGPALGFWQMEPATARDHWKWLDKRQDRSFAVAMVERTGVAQHVDAALQYNLPYQILMARVHYYRRTKEALPPPEDLYGQAERWKVCYNTMAGKGTITAYLESWQRFVAPHWSPAKEVA